jgi:hypothetical protein
MSVITLDKAPVDTLPTAPLLDVPQLDDLLDASIDSVIAQAARGTRTRKVSGRKSSAFQSHTARAWTRGGSVD